jgi:hypothetical protein
MGVPAQRSPVTPPNETLTGRHVGHSSTPVHTDIGPVGAGSNERIKFDVDRAKMPQPPAAESTGPARAKGEVPIYPWDQAKGPLPDSSLRIPRR